MYDGNSKSLSVECCLETRMRRDVKLLYDVMADTIGYIQVKMRAASLQLARTHRDYRDYKPTSLGASRGIIIIIIIIILNIIIIIITDNWEDV